MKGALAIVVAAGIGAGFVLPQGKMAEAPRAPAAAAAESPRSRPVRAAVAEVPARSGWGGETRLMRAPNGHFFATALVNGQPVEFVVDTGATTVALTVDDARRIGIPFSPAAFEVIGTGASGPVRGQEILIESISLDGKEVRALRGAVLEGLETSLLGQSYLSRIGQITISGDRMILR